MKVAYGYELPTNQKADALVVGVYEGLKGLTAEESTQLGNLNFSGKVGEVATIPERGIFKSRIYVGLGRKTKISADRIRVAAAKGIKGAKKVRAKRVILELFGADKLNGIAAKAVAEGIVLGNYTFTKYKREKEAKFEVERVTVIGKKEFKSAFENGYLLAEATNFTREIVNEPGNVITPVKLAEIAEDLSKEYGFKCKVFKEKELEKNRMVGILTVGRGSKNPPRFIHITYKPKSPKRKIVLVGKGVTFDSGGLDIKPEQYMKTMKADKSGACAVLGIMKAIGQLAPDVEVHGLIPTVENMPDGKAYRPDDIIVYRSGKSVEVHSTDAEGRLILADALLYGSELEPDVMIDMATLTGACVVALGHYTSGLFTDNNRLASTILKLSSETGEKMWKMPLDGDLEKDIEGTYTDLQNVGKTRYGGAITAALFLKNFVDSKKVKSWAHIDIAGPAFLDRNWKYYSAGATGQPVRTMVEFIVSES